MQRITQIHGLDQRLRDRIQHQQLAIAPADLLLRPDALGDIQQESLKSRHHAGGIANRDRRLHHGSNFPIFAANLELKIRHGTVFVEQFLQTIAIRRRRIER